MTDYSKLSDREIDRLVLNTIYGVHADDKDIQGCWSRGGFKYTSDASDAWPIITGNKIDINWGDDVHPALKGAVIASRGKLSATHDNPLRAAMIVFLQMQENKQ
jgi:hypothetical protein